VSVMDLSKAAEPSEGLAEDDADGKESAEAEGDVKIAAKAAAPGRPITVEITDSEGRIANMTLDDLKDAKT
jgi:hypothetical protein